MPHSTLQATCLARRIAIAVSALFGLAAALGQSPGASSGPLAEISGGRDVTGQNYAWTIRNLHSSPIVYIEIPHYMADTFEPPVGFEMGECTNLQRVGALDAPGVCRATASPETGIQPRLSGKVGMRLTRGGRDYRGRGTVTLRFADGREARIAGVELPTAPTALDRYLMPIGLGAVLALIIAIQAARRRRSRAKETPAS